VPKTYFKERERRREKKWREGDGGLSKTKLEVCFSYPAHTVQERDG